MDTLWKLALFGAEGLLVLLLGAAALAAFLLILVFRRPRTRENFGGLTQKTSQDRQEPADKALEPRADPSPTRQRQKAPRERAVHHSKRRRGRAWR